MRFESAVLGSADCFSCSVRSKSRIYMATMEPLVKDVHQSSDRRFLS